MARRGMWTVEWFAISLFIIGPLCSAAAAVDAARLSRPGNVHLVLSTPRPVLAYVRAAAWCAVPLIGIHLAAIVAGVVAGPVTEPSVGWLAMAAGAAVQCLSIVWYVALGSLIGRFASPLLAGLIAAGGAWLVFLPLSAATLGGPGGFALLDMGASIISQIGLTYHFGYLASQAAVFLVTAALFVVVGLRTRSGVRLPTFTGVVAGVAALAVLFAGQQVLPSTRKVDNLVIPTSCRGDAPAVCLYHEHRRFHEVVAGNIQTLSDAARDAGYEALTLERVAESSHSFRPGGGPKVVGVGLPGSLFDGGRMSLEDTADTLLRPNHCDRLRARTPPPDEFRGARGHWS